MRSSYKSKRPAARILLAAMIGLCAVLAGSVGPRTTIRAHAQETPHVPMLRSSAPNSPDSQLQAIVEDAVSGLGGTWGVAVKKLDTGQYAVYNGDKQQVSASLYKVWVLSELFRQAKAGMVDLDGYVTVTGDDAYYDASLGDLHLPPGTSLTLRRAAYLMVTVSDNTAATLLVRVLGPDNINSFMQQNGLTDSVLDWSGVGDNLTTPLDVLHEMEMIATSQMVDADSSKQMVDIMLDQQVNNLLAPGLPEGTPFAHKHGSLDSLLHDAGIVYGPSGPFVIVVMSSELDSYTSAWDNMPKLMSSVYQYFNSQPSSPALYFPESRQTVGHEFLKFWYTYGGQDILGLPMAAEQMHDGVLVQRFERATLELRKESTGSSEPGETQLVVVPAMIGQELATKLGLSWPRTTDPGPGNKGQYFPDTGQYLTGDFYDFWRDNGGEKILGQPISPSGDMMSPSDGKTYLTQWFQNARIEYHPEMAGGPKIVLARVGVELSASP